jgi:hypothetical protein
VKNQLTDVLSFVSCFLFYHQREETKKKEREQKAKLKDVNMAAPSFDRKILNEQHQREKDAKAKERAQPAENAKFDMANALFGGPGAEE